jgi:hypothetical protein
MLAVQSTLAQTLTNDSFVSPPGLRAGAVATGGVGGYYGARLAAVDEDVRFIARGAHLTALRTNGVNSSARMAISTFDL